VSGCCQHVLRPHGGRQQRQQHVELGRGEPRSGTHPTAAPGNTAGETDNIFFDGTTGKNGNKSCTWDYTPTNSLGQANFQNSYTQTVTFSDKQGFSVSSFADVSTSAAPTLTPNGASGATAITLTKGTVFIVDTGCTLFLQGYSSGGAVFVAGDGTAGEYLQNGGTVSYSGVGSNAAANTDSLKVPVHNAGVFKVNGNVGSSTFGSKLQVSGAVATSTSGVSFYQDNSAAEADISGKGTLWCVNDFKMTSGKLQTTDSQIDNLQVGTGGGSPVDGTVTLLGGTVNINPGTNVYGTLAILGTTGANVPTLNVGTVTLNFKVNMAAGSTQCDQLFVGYSPTNNSTGKANFGYNSGTTTVAINPQGTVATGHNWKVILFGTKTGDVTLNPPTGYMKTWETNDLKIGN
jgi:hypothetical protein